MQTCTLRLEFCKYARTFKTASVSLVIIALWAESYIQRLLVSFEKSYTTMEVYYVYQNTQVFIKKEKHAGYLILGVFLALILLYLITLLFQIWLPPQVSGYMGITI